MPASDASPPGTEPAVEAAADSAPAAAEQNFGHDGSPPAVLFDETAPTDPGKELEEISREQEGTVSAPPIERPLQYLSDRAAELEKEIGLRVGMAYTMLFQQATGGPEHTTGAAGDLDLLAKWTLIGRGTKNTGQIVFASEYRHQIGSHTPSDLGRELGTLLGTTNSFTERTMVVKDLYWVQRLLEDRLRIGIGRADPENLVGGHRLQSANTAFFNKAFSTNPTIPFPGSGLAAGVSVRPVDWFYTTVGATNADARTTTIGVEELLDNWNLFSFVEAGFTPTIEDLGAGRYRVALWHIDERDDAGKPEDQGISVILEQDLGEMWQVFARYGYSDAEVTGIRHLIEGGFGVKGLLGSKDNLTGFAVGNANPLDSAKRDETVVEVFHRWQVTAQSQFTIGAQVIISPGNAPDDDVFGVFSARLRLSF